MFSKSGGVLEWGNMRKERRKVGGGSLRELWRRERKVEGC
jgi:hypothetical protein